MPLDPITALATGAGAIEKTGKAIEGIEKIKTWLVTQPQAAAAELASVVLEVMKAPAVVNQAVDALFSVIDEATPKLAALSRVADGTLLREVEEKRPHCHRIGDIANRHLWQWLQQGGVDGPDAQELRDALANLGNADQDFFKDLEKFAKAIQEVASIAAQLAMNNQRAESLALLAKAAPALFAARKKANSLALQLTTMQTDFQRRALGLPPE